MAELLLGKPVADANYQRIDNAVAMLKDKGIEPCLAIIRAGEDGGSIAYERALVKKAEEHGIVAKTCDLPSDISQFEIETLIDSINANEKVHGVIVMQPLPPQIDPVMALSRIDPLKDVDCITNENSAKIYTNRQRIFAPATAQSVMDMLQHYNIDLDGKRVVTIGRSLVVGRPLSMLALHQNATITIAHSRTKHMHEVTPLADIVVLASGQPKHFGKEFFREGQVIIDVATTMAEDGSLVGDVNFEEVEPIVQAITPVPRGVGSVTTSVTLKFVCKAALLTLK